MIQKNFLYLFITLILVYKIYKNYFWKTKWWRYSTFFGALHVM